MKKRKFNWEERKLTLLFSPLFSSIFHNYMQIKFKDAKWCFQGKDQGNNSRPRESGGKERHTEGFKEEDWDSGREPLQQTGEAVQAVPPATEQGSRDEGHHQPTPRVRSETTFEAFISWQLKKKYLWFIVHCHLQRIITDEATVQQQRERASDTGGRKEATSVSTTGKTAGTWPKSQVHYGNLLRNGGSGKFVYLVLRQSNISDVRFQILMFCSIIMIMHVPFLQIDKYHTKIGLGWNKIREAFSDWSISKRRDVDSSVLRNYCLWMLWTRSWLLSNFCVWMWWTQWYHLNLFDCERQIVTNISCLEFFIFFSLCMFDCVGTHWCTDMYIVFDWTKEFSEKMTIVIHCWY